MKRLIILWLSSKDYSKLRLRAIKLKLSVNQLAKLIIKGTIKRLGGNDG